MQADIFELNCPHCDKLYKLPRDKVIKHKGKSINCRRCGQPFSIPELPEEYAPQEYAPEETPPEFEPAHSEEEQVATEPHPIGHDVPVVSSPSFEEHIPVADASGSELSVPVAADLEIPVAVPVHHIESPLNTFADELAPAPVDHPPLETPADVQPDGELPAIDLPPLEIPPVHAPPVEPPPVESPPAELPSSDVVEIPPSPMETPATEELSDAAIADFIASEQPAFNEAAALPADEAETKASQMDLLRDDEPPALADLPDTKFEPAVDESHIPASALEEVPEPVFASTELDLSSAFSKKEPPAPFEPFDDEPAPSPAVPPPPSRPTSARRPVVDAREEVQALPQPASQPHPRPSSAPSMPAPVVHMMSDEAVEHMAAIRKSLTLALILLFIIALALVAILLATMGILHRP